MRTSWGSIALLAVFAAATAAAAVAPPPADERAEARELLRTTVGMETSEGLGNVPKLASYLKDKFLAAGFPAEDVHVLPLGETASFVARYRGDGSGGKPILLLAHMDVVPAKREEWQRDPFTLIEENGFFFGRGTNDIKGELSAIVATMLRLKREGFVPTRDVIAAFTGDEETSQATTLDLATTHRDLVDAEFALNGDGGGGVFSEVDGSAQVYYLQGAEKTYATYELTTHNPGGHSSEPRDQNAIYDLAKAIDAVAAFHFPVEWNDWTIGSFKGAGAATKGELGEMMRRFAADPHDAEAAEFLRHEPGYIGRTRTTCVATMLSGGHAENALPQTATATVNCRIFPGTTPDEVRATLAKDVGDGVEVTKLDDPTAGPASPMRDDVMSAVADAVHAVYPGTPVVPDMAPYGTDGKVLRAHGIPTYGTSGIFIKESDSFSHGLNERIPVAAFDNALTHWYVLVRELAGKR